MHCAYGGVRALEGLSLTVEEGEIVALIGANGAGKTTALRAISGMLRPRSGTVTYAGEPATGRPPEDLVRRGLGHVPEGRRIFPGLTVVENLEVAAAWRRVGRRALRQEVDEVFELFPALHKRRGSRGWSLSGGEQQMLAIGRALMGRLRLLLLDEPSLGLAPNLVTDLFERIVEIGRGGSAILLVEQNAYLALRVSSRAYLLETGRLMLSGPAAELAHDPRVTAGYLG